MKAFVLLISLLLAGVLGGLASIGLTAFHSAGVAFTIGGLINVAAYLSAVNFGYRMGKGEFE